MSLKEEDTSGTNAIFGEVMLTIKALPILNDNYIWILCEGNTCIAVDPGTSAELLAYLQQHDLELTGILVTHQHGDHIGGIPTLLKQYPVPVYGPVDIALVTHPVKDNQRFQLPGFSQQAQVLAIPGHTLNHLAYLIENHLFCGDTLFGCGCGKLFEGTPEMMYHSLQRLAQLPDETLNYCAHEYTLANEVFALHVDPHNQALIQRMQKDQQRRQEGKPTLPSTIGLEKATNPFLRTPNVNVFARLRQKKDRFAG